MSQAKKHTPEPRSGGRAPRPRQGERGVALILAMVVLGTLLLGGLVTTGLRLREIRSSGEGLAAKRAYYCTEAGIDAGRDFFRQNAAQWGTYLATGFVFTGTASAAGGLPFAVRISDNRDEMPPAMDDPLQDRDYTVVLQSTCTDPVLQTVVSLQQHLTLNPLADPPTLAPRPGMATYATTAELTAGVGTDATGAMAMASTAVSASGLDLRMDRMVLQPAQMLGSWTARQYCGTTCNGWRSVTWTAAAPAGTLVTVRARSAPTLPEIATAAWVPLMSAASLPQVGPGSLRGRFIEVEVLLQTAIAGLSPAVTSVVVMPY